MTEFERKQHPVIFIGAGRKSYLLGILPNNNPYKEVPFRDLWDKGWRQERRVHEAARFQGKRPPFHPRTDARAVSNQYRRPAGQTFKRPDTKHSKPALTNDLANRFNKRHQTRATSK